MPAKAKETGWQQEEAAHLLEAQLPAAACIDPSYPLPGAGSSSPSALPVCLQGFITFGLAGSPSGAGSSNLTVSQQGESSHSSQGFPGYALGLCLQRL